MGFENQQQQPQATSGRGVISHDLSPSDDTPAFTISGTSSQGQRLAIWNVQSTLVPVLSLTADTYIDNPLNLITGEFIGFVVKQDATGNRKLSWSPAFIWTDNVEPVIASDPKNITIFQFFSDDGVNVHGKVFYQSPQADPSSY